jgi:hypothetical protein
MFLADLVRFSAMRSRIILDSLSRAELPSSMEKSKSVRPVVSRSGLIETSLSWCAYNE